MILPNKYLTSERSLLWIGGEILKLLEQPKTVSKLWNDIRNTRNKKFGTPAISYNWFILALDFW